jgi:RNA polymerase sigma-70 factor (ECF subfamily)
MTVVPDDATSTRTERAAEPAPATARLPLPDERELVGRARTDADAFSEIYRHYLPRVHSFVERRTGSVEVAEDVVSATFEKAWRSLGSFRWREPGIGPWLLRIAANEVTDHHRRRGREASDRATSARAGLTADRGSAVEEIAVGTADLPGDLAMLRRGLDRLPARYEQALSLRYLSELDGADAAAAMGLSKPTMAVVVHRALRAVRREIEREMHGGDRHEA